MDLAPIFKFYGNSVVISFTSTLLNILIVSMAAYVLARYTFKGSTFITLLLSASLLVPTSALLMPIYKIMMGIGMFYTRSGFYRTFFVIVFPLAKSGLATGAILQFLTSWNEFMFGLVLTKSTEVRTLPLALNYFTSQFSFNYTAMFAALTMVILPSIVIYVLLQEQVTTSMVAGSVKG